MLTKTIRTTAGLLALALAACTPTGEDQLEPSQDQLEHIEEAVEPADEIASPAERAGATIPAARFEFVVDRDEQREAESLRAESCSLDAEPREAELLAPAILAPGVADPGFRIEEDPIAASLAAQEQRELEDELPAPAAAVDDETLAAQARYLAQASEHPDLDDEARAALKQRELGD